MSDVSEKKYKIDLIVPVYNTIAYLDRCYQSLKNQTLEGIHIIFVDDGSTDDSVKYLDDAAAENPCVTVIHKPNGGLGSARNAGIDAATAEYVAFVDSDDAVDPDMYEKLYEAAKRHDADMVLSGVKHIGGVMFESSKVELSCMFEKEEIFEGSEGVKKLILGTVGALPEEASDSRYGFATWKNLFRLSIFKEHNIKCLSERVCVSEDAPYMVDYITHIRKAVGIPGAFYNYYRNPKSLSKMFSTGKYMKSKTLFVELEKRLSSIMPEAEYRIYLDRQFQAYARVACIHEVMVKQKGTCKRLLEIDKDPDLVNCLRRYPWWKLPAKQALFAGLMRYRLTFLQKLLVLAKSDIA